MNRPIPRKISALGRWTAIAVGIYTAVYVGHRVQTEGLTAPAPLPGTSVTASAPTPASQASAPR